MWQLQNAVRHYPWGSHTVIPELLGAPSPADRPHAELWMGAHPDAPSVLADGTGLDDDLAALDVAITRMLTSAAEAGEAYLAALDEADTYSRAARLLTHAGFGVVVEAGRALRWQDTPGNRDAVTALVTGALL